MPVVYRFGEFELWPQERRLLRFGQTVPIEPRVVEVIACLVQRANRLVSKRELLQVVWSAVSVGDGAVYRGVSKARSALRTGGINGAWIRTRGKSGYEFVGDVQIEDADDDLSVEPMSRKTRTTGCQHHESRDTLLVGREAMIRCYSDAIQTLAAGGDGCSFLVTGELGMGKSRVLREFSSVAERAGVRSIRAHLSGSPGNAGFEPWGEIISELAFNVESRKPRVPDWEPLLRDVHPILPGAVAIDRVAAGRCVSFPEQDRRRIFESARRLVVQASERMPTLICIDDLHDASDPALVLFRMLAESSEHGRLLVVGSCRSSEMRRHPKLGQLEEVIHKGEAHVCFELSRLAREDIEKLVERDIPDFAGEYLMDFVRDKSEGNPLFALELARFVHEMARSEEPAELARKIAHGEIVVPTGLRSVLLRRCEKLTSIGREVLEHAAVIGRRFDITLLRESSEQARSDVDAVLDRAVHDGLVAAAISNPGIYEFSQVLIRDVLYGAILPARRMHLHELVAESLSRIRSDKDPDVCAELAYHYLAAAPNGHAKAAAKYAELAARGATRYYAFENAASAYERKLTALRMMTPEDKFAMCETLLSIGKSYTRIGDDLRARPAFERAAKLAKEIGDGDLLTKAAIGMSINFGQPVDFGADPSALIRLLQDALAALPESPSVSRAVLLACLSFAYTQGFEPVLAREASQTSEAVARVTGDASALAFALLSRVLATFGDSPADDSNVRVVGEMIRVADSSGAPQLVFMANLFRVSSCFENATDSNELDDVLARHARAIDRSEEPRSQWWRYAFACTRALMRGDTVEAKSLADTAQRLGKRSSNSNIEMAHVAQNVQIDMLRGRFGEALKRLKESSKRFPRLQAWRITYVMLQTKIGIFDDTYEFVAEWHARDLETELRVPVRLFEAACLADVAVACNDRVLARRLSDVLVPQAGKNIIMGFGVGYGGPVDYFRAILAGALGQSELARDCFDSALDRARRLGSAPWVARILAVYGRLLVNSGRSDDVAIAKRKFAEALSIAERIAATGIRSEVEMIMSTS